MGLFGESHTGVLLLTVCKSWLYAPGNSGGLLTMAPIGSEKELTGKVLCERVASVTHLRQSNEACYGLWQHLRHLKVFATYTFL